MAAPCPRALASLQETQFGFHRRIGSAETPRSSVVFAADEYIRYRLMIK